jgi:hypothetical protein
MKQSSVMSFDTRAAVNPPTHSLPFTCKLSLKPLVDFWTQVGSGEHTMRGMLARLVQDQVRQVPELLEPLEDPTVITQHKELVDLLMTIVFPPASWDQAYAAAMIPFQLQMQSFYATPSFERLLTDHGVLRGRLNADAQTFAHVKILHAYALILQRLYGIVLDFEYPLIFTVTDPDTGLDRHFKPNMDVRFVEVLTVGEAPALDAEVKKHLLANLADPHALMTILPPERFVFQGFAVLNAEEVTDQEVLSSLKRDLIEKESIISNARFNNLQAKLRTLFRKPDLLFGLAALQQDKVLMLNYGVRIEHG